MSRWIVILLFSAVSGCASKPVEVRDISYIEYHKPECAPFIQALCVHSDTELSQSQVGEILAIVKNHVNSEFHAVAIRNSVTQPNHIQVVSGSWRTIDAIENIVILKRSAGGWVVTDVVESLHCLS